MLHSCRYIISARATLCNSFDSCCEESQTSESRSFPLGYEMGSRRSSYWVRDASSALVVLDYYLPKKNGTEVMRMLSAKGQVPAAAVVRLSTLSTPSMSLTAFSTAVFSVGRVTIPTQVDWRTEIFLAPKTNTPGDGLSRRQGMGCPAMRRSGLIPVWFPRLQLQGAANRTTIETRWSG